MFILIVTPAPPRSRHGNRTTALRWARILRRLGHHVDLGQQYKGQACDLLIALHARRSSGSIDRFHSEYPELPLIVALTGTDLYDDIHHDVNAQRSLALATRLVVLHGLGADELPNRHRAKSRVVYQSASAPRGSLQRATDAFEVCVMGHLRQVKDPFRTADATRLLPAASRVRLLQLGAAMEPGMAERAEREMCENPRYRWLGDQPRRRALEILAASHLLVLSSRAEGGANVISEALACGVPILSSRIAGSVGLLGDDYPGYFEYGDTQALANLINRGETEASFRRLLEEWCEKRAYLVDPAREQAAWAELIAETCT